jgi:hypothetical protein
MMNSRTYNPAAGNANNKVQPWPQRDWTLQAITAHNSTNATNVWPNCHSPRTHDGRANRAHNCRSSLPGTTFIVAWPEPIPGGRAAEEHCDFHFSESALVTIQLLRRMLHIPRLHELVLSELGLLPDHAPTLH